MTSEQLLSIEEIVFSLESDDIEEREAAIVRLQAKVKQGLNAQEGIFILRAACREFLSRKNDFASKISTELMRAAAAYPQSAYIPVIVELYPEYNDSCRGQALRLLAAIEDREAAIAYMNILRTHIQSNDVPILLPTLPLQNNPRDADVFFPEILKYADLEVFECDVYLLLLSYFQAKLLTADDPLPYTKQVLDTYRKYEDKLGAAQQSEGVAWMWEDDYQEWRTIASILLDLMGHLPSSEVVQELEDALTYQDPRLKFFAVISLLRQGKAVNRNSVRDVARAAEVRNFLFNELTKLNQISLYPDEFRTQEAFAESDMVNWLVYPTELGQVPDEIELMEVVSADTKTSDGIIDYYIFRFRVFPPHWAAKEGWMAGISGPFLRKDAPSTTVYGDTFSTFQPWESKTPEEHLGDIQKVLKSWYEHHTAKKV